MKRQKGEDEGDQDVLRWTELGLGIEAGVLGSKG